MMKPRDIVQHELIGLKARVVGSSHLGYVGIEGQVIDETRNTLTIMHKNKKRIVIKKTAVFDFTTPEGTVVETDGKNITGRPEDRVKNRIKRLW